MLTAQAHDDGIQDYNVLKSFSRDDLMQLVPKDFVFKTKPWHNQLACFVASIANGGFLNCMDLGTGKTKVAIDICRFLKIDNNQLKVLVVCLNSAVENWKDEAKIHSGRELRATCLQGTMPQRWKKLRGNGLFIINFEGLMYMLTETLKIQNPKFNPIICQGCEDCKACKHKGDCKQKDVNRYIGKRDISNELMKKMINKNFDVLLIDESHCIKSRDSLIYKAIHRLSKTIDHRYLLTGTPFGNTLMDVWTQYNIVDFGETFGKKFEIFRNAHFFNKGKKIGWGKHSRTVADWAITTSGKAKIEAKLFTKAIRYEESEVNDLPEKVYRTIKYDLSKEQVRVYNGIIKHLDPTKGKTFKFSTDVRNKIIALRQICSGFGRTGLQGEHEFKNTAKNPKLEALKDLISVNVDSSKLVVFHEFIKEGEMIEAMLKKMKIKYAILNGRVKDKHAEYTRFQKVNSCRVMVAHPKSGGASINLTAGTYCVFFSNGYSVINRKQCEKRIHRGGQVHRCFYYDLIGTGTVELAIFEKLKAGIDAFDGILNKSDFMKMLGKPK